MFERSISVELPHRYRHRDQPISWEGREFINGTLTGLYDFKIVPGQETWDEPHVWRAFEYQKKHPGTYDWSKTQIALADVGGPFYTIKRSYEDDTPIIHGRTSNGYEYVGPQFAANGNVDRHNDIAWPSSYSASDDLSLAAAGTTAISRVAPTNPHSSALTFIGELMHDGLPSAVGASTIKHRDPGGEYLNYQFGILPMISDLKKLRDSYVSADRYLTQYYRNSGKQVRRRYEFPPTREVVSERVIPGYLPQPTLATPLYETTAASLREVITEETRRWFSGAFTYYAQPPSSVLSIREQIQSFDQLYGTTPSLSAFWELLPWSWAADWVTNFGDVVNNISLFSDDGLVMAYGYVMEHKRRVVEYTNTGASIRGYGPVVTSQRFITETKRRIKATPFGFGLELGGFTDRQWAILAALGLSRGRGALV